MKPSGFTLVEVLVALAIAAVSLAASLKATNALVNTNEDLRLRLLATWSAENRLAQIRLEKQWPDVGNTQFACPQSNRQLQCRQKVTSMAFRDIRAVEIEVFEAATESGGSSNSEGGVSVLEKRAAQRVARLVGFAVRP